MGGRVKSRTWYKYERTVLRLGTHHEEKQNQDLLAMGRLQTDGAAD